LRRKERIIMKWFIPLFLLLLFSISSVGASFIGLLAKMAGPAIKAGVNAAKNAAKNAIKEQIKKKREEIRRKKREAKAKRRARKKEHKPHGINGKGSRKILIPQVSDDLDDLDSEIMENLIEWKAYNFDDKITKEKINRIQHKDVRTALSSEI
jgi:hypothetical protein